MAASASLASSFALKTARIVGRESECNLIRTALETSDGRTRVFYFVAGAGVGKTRLLEQAQRLARQSTGACFMGMFDFFETELHSNSALEKRIVREALENLGAPDSQEGAYFPRYTSAREKYEQQKRQLTKIEDANKARIAIGRALVEDLNAIGRSRNCKLVFCFDTLEALQNESDNVQKIIDQFVRLQVIESRAWLVQHLPLLENAVIVMAGRKKHGLGQYLTEAFASPLTSDGSAKVEYNSPAEGLGNLKEQDVQDFFQAMYERYTELEQEFVEPQDLTKRKTAHEFARKFSYYEQSAHNIWVCTKGWPLMLGFICDLITLRQDLPDEFLPDAQRLELDAPNIAATQARIQNTLYEGARSNIGEAARDALPYIALLRKGVSARLLERAAKIKPEGWDADQCQSIIDALQEISFTKPKEIEGETVIFLHDQFYDLMHEARLREILGFSYDENLQDQISHFDLILDEVIQAYEEAKTSAYSHAKIDTPNDSAAIKRDPNRLIAEQLYYKLLRDNAEGYKAYSVIFDRAILDRQIGLDMLVREEMLRFFDPILLAEGKWAASVYKPPQNLDAGRIERGAAIRWVHRLIAIGHYRDAIQAARAFKASKLADQYDPLFVPILDMWEGEASAYLRDYEFANPKTILEHSIESHTDQKTIAALNTPRLKELHARNLGRAYNTYGYLFGRENDWDNAIENYNKARPLLREAGQPQQIADTLKNLALAYAKKGEFQRAQDFIKKAEKICRENDLGDFWMSLCRNTRALIEIEIDRPHRARAFAQEAAQEMRDLRAGGELRGIALATTVQGRACRRVIKEALYGQDDPVHLYEQGRDALLEALRIFREGGDAPEKDRVPEILNELGCLARDWANLLRTQYPNDAQIAALEQEADTYFAETLHLSEPLHDIIGRADTKNDQAELRLNQGRLAEALALIQEADQIILNKFPEYNLHAPLEPSVKPRTNLYTLLGTNALLRGHVYLRQALDKQGKIQDKRALENAIKSYVLASAYFDKFGGDEIARSLNAQRIHTTFEKLPESGLVTSELERLNEYIYQVHTQWHEQYPSFPESTTFGKDFSKNYSLMAEDE